MNTANRFKQGLDSTRPMRAKCARGRSGTPQGRCVPQRHSADARNAPIGPQRATGGVPRAGRRPRLGGPEEYKRSTRSPGGGAWRRSAGMRQNSNLRYAQCR